MRHRSVTSLALFASVAALSFVAGASPAMASVTIGQLAPSSPPANCAFGPLDIIVPTVTSGNSYVVPGGGGRITSWSTNAAAGAGQMLTMKVVRKVADPMTYRAVGHDGPRPLDPGVLNTFAVDIAVHAPYIPAEFQPSLFHAERKVTVVA